jgi:hypothetical protein
VSAERVASALERIADSGASGPGPGQWPAVVNENTATIIGLVIDAVIDADADHPEQRPAASTESSETSDPPESIAPSELSDVPPGPEGKNISPGRWLVLWAFYVARAELFLRTKGREPYKSEDLEWCKGKTAPLTRHEMRAVRGVWRDKFVKHRVKKR